jgi:hypothetical protein
MKSCDVVVGFMVLLLLLLIFLLLLFLLLLLLLLLPPCPPPLLDFQLYVSLLDRDLDGGILKIEGPKLSESLF